VVAQPASLVGCELDDALGSRGERRLGKGGACTSPDCTLYGFAYLVGGDFQLHEDAHSNPALFGNQAQQDVLGANKAVV
jgi:hypothetical protein